jgi:glycosyltransferase involved in cell wall biosynthesis
LSSDRSASGRTSTTAPIRFTYFPRFRGNPYQRLLYDELARVGFEIVTDSRFDLAWLVAARRRVDGIHFHWPQGLYAYGRRPQALAPALSWATLGSFAARLTIARLLGYRLVWTIHEVFPHEGRRVSQRVDRLAGRLLARACHVVLTHDEATASIAEELLGRPRNAIEIVPHPSYASVYPEGRDREEVRAELGIPRGATVLLCFGSLSSYKGVESLLRAFGDVRSPTARLVLAGWVRDEAVADVVSEAARADPRIVSLPTFVPEGRVAELFRASDVAVLPRTDGGTSGALLLAISMGLPVVAARREAYSDLTGSGECGWLFTPDDSVSLAGALEAAVTADPSTLEAKGAAAGRVARERSWRRAAELTAAYIRSEPRRESVPVERRERWRPSMPKQ